METRYCTGRQRKAISGLLEKRFITPIQQLPTKLVLSFIDVVNPQVEYTPMHVAAAHGHNEIIDYFHEKSVDVNIPTPKSYLTNFHVKFIN